MTLPAAAVARFRADVARVLDRRVEPGERLALAVSGGPDSMAMLALGAAAFPGQVAAATVDHRLRAGSAGEAEMVARWCADAGIPHETLVPATPISGSAIQAQARQVRYDLLARSARDRDAICVATAHHIEDQAETFLMRAVRGSGPAGLAGIRPRREHGVMEPVENGPLTFREWTMPIVRPLLGWHRADLRAIVVDARMPFVEDPSNLDERFERSRVRKLMTDSPWLDPAGLARAAGHAWEAHAALESIGEWLWRTRRRVPAGADDADGQRWLDMADLPRDLRRRLSREAIGAVKALNGIAPDFDTATNIEALLDSVEAGRAATQAGVLVSRKGDVWHFREAPPRRAT